ncbi:MAG: hypothetical protein IPH84_11425 [Bacteroidales bacterium]|nr:hypothetical protein [Bacteroidales bacterium]
MKKYYLLFPCILLAALYSFAQSSSRISKLIPKGVINPVETIQPMPPFMVRVEYVGQVTETTSCSKETVGEIKVAMSWYNNNDETGKMMLGMISSPSELQKQWQKNTDELTDICQQYKNGGYGENLKVSEVKTEEVTGGKLCFFDVTSPCVESAVKASQRTFARCFIFDGKTQCDIRIESQCSPDEIKAMIKMIVFEVNNFNFSGLL